MNRSRGTPGSTESWPIPKELWILKAGTDTARQKECVTALRREVESLTDVNIEEVRSATVAGRQGRQTEILSPKELRKLYVRCHRAHVVVAAVGGVHVRLDPSSNNASRMLPLERVVAYKAAGYFVTSRPEEAERALLPLAGTVRPRWDNHRDPRCLPMHAFAPGCQHDLDTGQGLTDFEADYQRKRRNGKGTCLVDSVGREWPIDQTMHGADSLHTRGLILPNGFHWDVQTGKRGSVFTNGWERWETAKSSHINVHPDGYVRAPHARLTWTWEKTEQNRRRKPQ